MKVGRHGRDLRLLGIETFCQELPPCLTLGDYTQFKDEFFKKNQLHIVKQHLKLYKKDLVFNLKYDELM